MSDLPPTPSAWDDYRRRRAQLLAVWIGGFVGIALVSFLVVAVAPRWLEVAVRSVYFVGYFIAVAVLGYRWASFPCPRCHRAWFTGARRDQRTCVHCGLPMWSEDVQWPLASTPKT